MPASPSFPSETRTKCKKRKRDPQISRRQKQEMEEEEEEDEPLPRPRHNDDDDELEPTGNADDPQHATLLPPSHESEVLSESGERICDFPPVVKHAVNRPHSSVLAIVASERANQRRRLQQGPAPDSSASLGKCVLRAAPGAFRCPRRCSGFDQDRTTDGASSTYVITPPQIMEGRGVVKRIGTRAHVLPVHSDWFSPTAVHRLERQVVPHYFSGRLLDYTSEKYMECRNYIVAKYMENLENRFMVSGRLLDYALGASKRGDGENWNDQETLLLLEAIEIYNENWNEIAEHAGTMSKAQCILHFLRLPMENGLLENIEVPSMSSSLLNGDDYGRSNSNYNVDSAGSCHQDTGSESRLPFANSGNPVMALVAFLASAVGPRVAAACAHASLACLRAMACLLLEEFYRWRDLVTVIGGIQKVYISEKVLVMEKLQIHSNRKNKLQKRTQE